MEPDYALINTSALVMLAGLILRRAKLDSLPLNSRAQAIAIILGVRPAPPRRLKP